MNFTKFMCKTFDTKNKKSVTVEDITNKVLETLYDLCIILVIIILVAIVLATIFNFVGLIILSLLNYDIEEVSTENTIVGFLLIAPLTISLYIISYIYEKIKNIKVVECPLKDEEETKT